MRAEKLDFRLLGPLEVWAGGENLPLGGAKQRAVLAVLLVHANEPVSSDQLIDALWGERPPDTGKTALQGYITQLRRLLEPSRKKRAAGEVLVTTAAGYVLRVADGALDRDRFEALAARGHEALADGRAAEAADLCSSALALWRGPALAEFAYEPWAQTEGERLAELRLLTVEDRIEAELELGHHAEVVAELETLVADQPLRERPRGLLMLALYRAGRQAEALEAYQQARRALVGQLGINLSPELRDLQSAILRQDPQLARRPAARRPPTNLPASPTPLVGRERELDEAAALLTRHDVRLLTLTGPGGSGKTRLALELAERGLPHFPDGIFLVELASIAEPEGVLAAIARVLELRGGGRKPIRDQLKAAVAQRRLLLVLDNLEQVLDVSPALAELLASCPRLTLLGTSRAPLHLLAEHEYPLGPLAEGDAAELFRLRAKAVRPDFSADGEVDEICRYLDRLPLAIELAAARVRILPAQALLERLASHQSLVLLTGGARDLPERQRTLRGTLEWSHSLLDPAEQKLFARLAVFEGGFTLAAAEAICEASLDLLGTLCDQSLLLERNQRFSLLETVREFALEQLEISGDAHSIRERYAEWFSAEAFGLTAKLRTGDPSVNAAVTTELENFRSAFEWSLEHDRPELAHRIMYALQFYFGTHATLREGCEWAYKLEQAGGEPQPLDGALGLHGASQLSRLSGDIESAERQSRAALGFARKAGDDLLLGAVLQNVALIALERDETDRARSLAEEALLLRESGDSPIGIARAKRLLAGVELEAGEYRRARDLVLAGIPVFERESTLDLIQALTLLGALLRRTGRPHEARVELQRAARLCGEIKGGGDDLSDILIELAAVEAQNAAENAAIFVGYAQRAWETMGFPPWRLVDVDDLCLTLRKRLGERRFEAAAKQGRRLAFDQALELALDADSEVTATPG
jgi:predicted ATPase/DNA-binding SARP family transcriptional activator